MASTFYKAIIHDTPSKYQLGTISLMLKIILIFLPALLTLLALVGLWYAVLRIAED